MNFIYDVFCRAIAVIVWSIIAVVGAGCMLLGWVIGELAMLLLPSEDKTKK